MAFCSQCGEQLTSKSKFCHACGAKSVAVLSKTPVPAKEVVPNTKHEKPDTRTDNQQSPDSDLKTPPVKELPENAAAELARRPFWKSSSNWTAGILYFTATLFFIESFMTYFSYAALEEAVGDSARDIRTGEAQATPEIRQLFISDKDQDVQIFLPESDADYQANIAQAMTTGIGVEERGIQIYGRSRPRALVAVQLRKPCRKILPDFISGSCHSMPDGNQSVYSTTFLNEPFPVD